MTYHSFAFFMIWLPFKGCWRSERFRARDRKRRRHGRRAARPQPIKRKEEPIIARRIEKVDDDQQRIHGEIDEEMHEEAPLSPVGEHLLAPSAAL